MVYLQESIFRQSDSTINNGGVIIHRARNTEFSPSALIDSHDAENHSPI